MQRDEGVSVGLAVHVIRGLGGELHACLGVDIQAPRSAPGRKLVGPERRSDHELALPPQLAFGLLGFQPPQGIDVGQEVAVFHHGLDALVVLQRVPGYADGAWDMAAHADPRGGAGVGVCDAA